MQRGEHNRWSAVVGVAFLGLLAYPVGAIVANVLPDAVDMGVFVAVLILASVGTSLAVYRLTATRFWWLIALLVSPLVLVTLLSALLVLVAAATGNQLL